MKIRSLNNATVIINSENCSLLIDPWLIGTLYGGAWSPFAMCNDLDFLKKVTHVFISHIHEDHWDRETLILLDREVQIFIPELPINKVLKKYIEDLGFSNVKFVEPYKKKILSDIDLTIIPPMNAFGQELGSYIEGYEYDATNIDTSLLVEDKKNNTSHLFLCDNTPYDIKILHNLNVDNLTSLWYPFNSYAQDFPVCYELSEENKKDIHEKMHRKRKEAIEKCVAFLKPKFYLPHSADFILNGPFSKSFEDYTSVEYMDRKLVANTYSFQDITCSKSEYADYGDEIESSSEGELNIRRNIYPFELLSSTSLLNQFQSSPIRNEPEVLENAFSEMLNRCDRLKIDLSPASDWLLKLVVENNKYIFSYKNYRLIGENEQDSSYKTLTIMISRNQLAALMSRELHWNNAQIGCHLKVKRVPNEYCEALYKSLNFLHM